jgi:hypothetical protein
VTSTSIAINPRGTKGFWSYVHKDDDAELGRIRQLARDVASQFEMLTGEVLEFFFDRDTLQWGDDWKQKVDEAIAAGALFIPVLTPRYFMSPECRRELNSFARQATSLGVKELVLPIYYVTVPELDNQATTDDLFALVQTFQWEDWRELRFKEPSSESYRRAVAQLAERLVAAIQEAEQAEATPASVPPPDGETEGEDASPGLIDRLAASEEAMPLLNDTLGQITKDMELVGRLAQEATADMKRADRQAPGFAARLVISRKLAKQLADPAQRMSLAADAYISQLHAIDDGLRLLIELAPAGAPHDADVAKSACMLFQSIRQMNLNARSTQGILQDFVASLVPVENMARDLRPPLRRLREGLTKMVESGQVMEEWVRLIDASDLKCPEERAESTP